MALYAGAALWAGPVSAHAFLRSAEPAVGSTLHEAPHQVVLDFTETLEPRFSSITVQDAAGQRVDAGDMHVQGDAAHLAVGLKLLPPGTYTVTWHATSTDTHKTQGRFGFTLAPGAP